MRDMDNTDKMERGYEEVCTGCGETVCLSKEEHDQWDHGSTSSCAGSANKCLTFRTNCVRLFQVMREIDIKIQKLEKEIMFGKWLAFDPIKDHQLKVRKFNIEKRKLLDAEAQKNKK